eukprot:gnl/MRDRNA2_/MRDRNA2_183562_c0_seq1.p1 gnl/MRDRNA2_/MRDRNA2_183562_c0~~gnl/MRDRNA2_/MRDRNA2_183562_c0_seq1.p1  ORF type:complete len:254 (+),score=44.16 gnl/MRDRNA2_/MRDRNA2_183562_c0_seq1:95-856(+)
MIFNSMQKMSQHGFFLFLMLIVTDFPSILEGKRTVSFNSLKSGEGMLGTEASFEANGDALQGFDKHFKKAWNKMAGKSSTTHTSVGGWVGLVEPDEGRWIELTGPESQIQITPEQCKSSKRDNYIVSIEGIKFSSKVGLENMRPDFRNVTRYEAENPFQVAAFKLPLSPINQPHMEKLSQILRNFEYIEDPDRRTSDGNFTSMEWVYNVYLTGKVKAFSDPKLSSFTQLGVVLLYRWQTMMTWKTFKFVYSFR